MTSPGANAADATPGADRTTPALIVTILGLAAFNATRSRLPSGLHLTVAMVAFVLLVAAWASVSSAELGLGQKDLGRGLAYGAGAFALVTVVLVVAAFIPAAKGFFDDARADVGVGSMLIEVLIEVPLGTVLLEELAFRGSLLALLRRRLPVWPAVLASSLLFGCWHIGVAISSASSNAAVPDSGGGLVLTVLGTVAATTVAGIVFCWLRLRSGSLVAPMLAHIATNSVAFTVAWVLAR